MRKFLLGIFCGVLLVGLALVVFAAALVRLGGPQRPAVENGSTLMLRLEGEIGEVGTAELPFFLPGQPSNVTVHEVWSALKSASKDSRIAAVAILPAGVGAGWGKLEEIRRAILEVRRSGKPVYAWLRNPGLREY